MSILKAPKRETIDDLLKVEGKAELINGRIIRFKPYGTVSYTHLTLPTILRV